MTSQVVDAPLEPDASRVQRRREVEARSMKAAFADAIGTAWTIAIWFWGIFLIIQIAVALIANRFAGRGIDIANVTPYGAPQIFLFVMGIVTGAGFLTIHDPSGGTRRGAIVGWLVAAPVLGVSFAVVNWLFALIVKGAVTAVGGQQESILIYGENEPITATAALSLIGTVMYLTGFAVFAAYRRWGGWLGTLALLVTLAPAAFMVWSFEQGHSVEASFPGVGTSGAGWIGAVLALPLAAGLAHLLLRRIPLA